MAIESLTEWIAVIIFSLGIIKTLSFTISPKLGKNMTKSIIKNYPGFKKFVISFGIIVGSLLIYLALKEITLAQLIVGGYGLTLIIFVTLFTAGDGYKKIAQEWVKKSDSWWRKVCLVFLAILLILVYYLI
jgi:hypothetical protein